jgi:hypothetical protein
MNTVKHGNAGPENYLWPGPKTIKDANGIVQLAVRWSNALQKGWRGLNTVDASYVLAQYAPDGAISFKSKPNSGLATGSTLLPTVSGIRYTTTALRKTYFEDIFLPSNPVPIFDPATLQFRVLSKDVRAFSTD